jgi:hypothetical protein
LRFAMHMTVRSALVGGLIFAAAAGCRSVEPSDAELRAAFEEHRVLLDELRQVFEQDVKRNNLTSVSASSVTLTRCGDGRRGDACLALERWREYASRLEGCGVQAIESHETPGIYFQIDRSRFRNQSFRFRGFVYAPGVPRVVHDHDDTEERVDLGNGWYSYLIIDT